MRQTALTAGMVAIGGVTVGDEPAKKGFADQGRQFFLAPAADAKDDRLHGHRDPHPHQGAVLIPRGFVEMDDLGGPDLFDELSTTGSLARPNS